MAVLLHSAAACVWVYCCCGFRLLYVYRDLLEASFSLHPFSCVGCICGGRDAADFQKRSVDLPRMRFLKVGAAITVMLLIAGISLIGEGWQRLFFQIGRQPSLFRIFNWVQYFDNRNRVDSNCRWFWYVLSHIETK